MTCMGIPSCVLCAINLCLSSQQVVDLRATGHTAELLGTLVFGYVRNTTKTAAPEPSAIVTFTSRALFVVFNSTFSSASTSTALACVCCIRHAVCDGLTPVGTLLVLNHTPLDDFVSSDDVWRQTLQLPCPVVIAACYFVQGAHALCSHVDLHFDMNFIKLIDTIPVHSLRSTSMHQ